MQIKANTKTVKGGYEKNTKLTDTIPPP